MTSGASAGSVKPADLHLGASVIAKDEHKVGRLSRFVVRQSDLKLTHIVVDTGIFRSGDWKGAIGLSHDRMIPMQAIQRADHHEVRITMTADEFKELSINYADDRFAQIEDVEPGELDRSDVRRFLTSIPGEPGPYVMLEKTATPAGEFEIEKDSPVWRLQPHQKIGEVDDVLFDEKTKKMSRLVVRRGFLFSKEVELPVEYIIEVVADIVRVDIDDTALKRLQEHHADG